MSRINEEVRAEMARQRFTYADMARAVGKTRQNTWRKLTADKTISVDDLNEFAQVLTIPAWQIIRRAEEGTSKPTEKKMTA